MPIVKTDLERRLYQALKRILKYGSVQRLHRTADAFGLGEHEHVEMAYENVLEEAKRAVHGVRERRTDA